MTIAAAERPLQETYSGLRVLVTGHTGFKGAWLCLWLSELGARVAGFSDIVPSQPSAFDIFASGVVRRDFRGDIRDAASVLAAVEEWQPDLIFHLAAQPIVRLALRDPLATFGVNVMGTAAVLEAARAVPSVRAVLVVTSDKVYQNDNTGRAFIETDPLGGHEPYGASKAAAEIVAATYRSGGFHRGAGSRNQPLVATARAGNVIGGGDWAADRLIPDAVRALTTGGRITIRSPRATRPWQHVLEPVGGYLLHAHALLADPEATPAALNFGPEEAAARSVEEILRLFLKEMQPLKAELVVEEDMSGSEARMLMVSSAEARRTLGWAPAWTASEAVARVAEWHLAHCMGTADLAALSRSQIADYCDASPVKAFARIGPVEATP